MATIVIELEVDDGDPSADPSHSTGLTNAAYERLTGHTEEYGPGSLGWLGEVQDVRLKGDE
jgi:hypothetical protein